MLVSWVLSWPQHLPQSEPLAHCSPNAPLRSSVQSAPLKLRKAQSRKLCATSHPHYNANCSRSRLWIEIKTAEITVVLISILFWVEPESSDKVTHQSRARMPLRFQPGEERPFLI